MKFAITPCPNDTFTYKALACSEIESDFEFVFEDIETLNLEAQKATFPITKMSFAQYLDCSQNYELLDAGAALGVGTGPVLVGRSGADFNEYQTTLVPGMNTTGALLLRKFCGEKTPKLEAAHFRKILDSLASGERDFGVLIHEGRFVYQSMGLSLISDLGEYWTISTGLPVPLGCICVRKDFAHLAPKINALIRESLKRAFADPESTYPYVREKAQYLEPDVLQRHIYAFVNDYSFDISNIKSKLLAELKKCRK